MEVVLLIMCAVSIILSGICLCVLIKKSGSVEISRKDKREITDGFGVSVGVIASTVSETQKMANTTLVSSFNALQENLIKREEILEKAMNELNLRVAERLKEMSESQESKLEQLRANTQTQIREMREDNNEKLSQIKETVDEKLTKTINERFNQSFEMLSKQLENVYKSLGEMQNMATSVGALTKVLSNVKTTGILGEVQLAAILEQMLTRDMYDVNVITANGRDPVEFAIKLPGQVEGEVVYLPIDSKFPFTVYSDLLNAYEENDFDTVKSKKDQLKNTVKSMAKDIKQKYVYPPKTTNFAIMFLPTEGLYAEIAKMGLIEELQSTYNITIAGPTTMSALLNSLQMGFNTLAIQKKSGEVWRILGAVKTEFEKYNEVVAKIQNNFEKTSKDFDALVGTRSRMIASKLRTVDKLEVIESQRLLDLDQNIDGEQTL